MRIGISFKNMREKRTGADNVMPAIVAELQALGCEDEYFLFFAPPELVITASNFRVVPVASLWQNPVLNVIWHHLILWTYVFRYRLDLVHLPYLRLPLYCPCPIVTTIHDLAESRTPGHYRPLTRFYRVRMLRMLGRRVSHVVTISENSKRDIEQLWGIRSDRISVVYCGVAADFHPMDKKRSRVELSRKYGLDGAYLLYVGALEHPNKNLVRLMQAFGVARRRFGIDVPLVLTGMERGDASPIYTAVETEALQAYVRFLNYVPFADLPLLYNGGEALIYPSLYEGFGLPPVEAMACGLPVACSNTGSLPEVVGDAAVLFDPRDLDEMVDAMVRVLTDQKLRNEKVTLGFDRVKMYSWKSAARQLCQLYRQIARAA